MARRSKEQRERDLQEISSRYLRGEYQVDIAKSLGVSQGTVSNDLAELQRRWMASSIRDFDEIKAQQLARIDELEREYWEQYQASKKPFRRVTRKRRGTKPEDAQIERAVTIEQRTGDPRYLSGIQWCVAERNKIIGGYAPAVTQLEGKDGERIVIEVVRIEGNQD